MPRWDFQINVADVFHNDDLPFEEKRDTIVKRLRDSAWLRGRSPDDLAVEAVDNLAHAEDAYLFDRWWQTLYDCADADRAWIQTF